MYPLKASSQKAEGEWESVTLPHAVSWRAKTSTPLKIPDSQSLIPESSAIVTAREHVQVTMLSHS